MGYQLVKADAKKLFGQCAGQWDVYAPKRMEGEGCFSDTDVVRYGRVYSLEEIEWEKKSDYSFKEVLLPINETLFYFTEEETSVPKGPEKEILVFLRACDGHAVKRLDEIYLKNGFEDVYYRRIREKVSFILMGCPSTCDSGFCASMGTNRWEEYDAYIKPDGDMVFFDIKKEALAKTLAMQDIFYRDNANVGERRRVWASCQIDGYTEMAGGHEYRKSQGERMRFKVMHKIYDYKKRFGVPMCVGCGRCDDVCPEYISYSHCVNRLAKEGQADEE